MAKPAAQARLHEDALGRAREPGPAPSPGPEVDASYDRLGGVDDDGTGVVLRDAWAHAPCVRERIETWARVQAGHHEEPSEPSEPGEGWRLVEEEQLDMRDAPVMLRAYARRDKLLGAIALGGRELRISRPELVSLVAKLGALERLLDTGRRPRR